jgi:hypothetical protein
MTNNAERRTERIPLLMTPSELKALDDWAFANRIRSRGEAIRRLIEAGLNATENSSAASPGGSGSTTTEKPAAPRARKPRSSDSETKPARRLSKLDQLRAMREHGVR